MIYILKDYFGSIEYALQEAKYGIERQEATAIIQVLDKVGLTSVVAVKMVVNCQILTVWMWYDERETRKSQVFGLRTWKNGVVIH